MNILKLLCKIKSHNIIKVQTSYPEKVLNRIKDNEIYVWQIHYERNTQTLTFKVLNTELTLLSELLTPYNSSITSKEVLGVEAFFEFVRKRKVFFISFFICFLIALTMSTFVWEIDIYGLNEKESSRLLSYLFSSGIHQSIPKSKIDIEKLEYDITHWNDEFKETKIEIDGISLYITISKKDKPLEIYDNNVSCDLVALENGKIEVLEVEQGTKRKEVGDYVTKGEVIISGVVDYEFNEEKNKSTVHAKGKVLLKKTVEVKDFRINTYKHMEGADFIYDRVIYLFGKEFSFSNKKEGNFICEKHQDLVLKLKWIELPILYDEKRWYNINDCILKSSAELNSEITSNISELVGLEVGTFEYSYKSQEAENNALIISSNVTYLENMVIQKPIKESDLVVEEE